MQWQVLINLENLKLTSSKSIFIQNDFRSSGPKSTFKLKQQIPFNLWAPPLHVLIHFTQLGKKNNWQMNSVARKILNFLRMLPQKTKGSQTYSWRRVPSWEWKFLSSPQSYKYKCLQCILTKLSKVKRKPGTSFTLLMDHKSVLGQNYCCWIFYLLEQRFTGLTWNIFKTIPEIPYSSSSDDFIGPAVNQIYFLLAKFFPKGLWSPEVCI